MSIASRLQSNARHRTRADTKHVEHVYFAPITINRGSFNPNISYDFYLAAFESGPRTSIICAHSEATLVAVFGAVLWLANLPASSKFYECVRLLRLMQLVPGLLCNNVNICLY